VVKVVNRVTFAENPIIRFALFRAIFVQTQTMENKQAAIDLDANPELAGLVYVNDQEKGIVRVRKGDGFTYLWNGSELTSEKDLERIKKLVIPPAWEQVWICKKPNGHIQCTGYDARNRKQYRYHVQWQESRNQSKFMKLYEFGKVLPKLRAQIRKDMAKRSLTEEKVLATVLSLMECTYIRIGSNQYEKANNSYGLTTLKDKHVKIEGDRLQFSFVGKKGVAHRIGLKNRQLARIVKECRDIPGKELFQYLDSEGNHKAIDSGKVNSYIHTYTNGDFTAKDLRTWAGSLNSLHAFYEIGEAETATEKKKKIIDALDRVSEKLGNTRTVCKKYYVHPLILELYENNELSKFLKSLKKEQKHSGTGLTDEEKILMKILKQAKS